MFERICWFYNQVKNNGYPSRRKYEKKFEISDSTAKRDIMFIRDRLGAPLEYDKTKKGYYLTDNAFEIPSFWFDRSHLLLMIGVCRQLHEMSDGMSADVKKLVDRIESLLTMSDGSRILDLISFQNVEWRKFDSLFMEQIIEALLERQCLHITYHAAHSDEITDRVIEPYRFHNYMGNWHIIAFCRYRNAPRMFLPGRIINMNVLKERFTHRKFDVDSHLDETFGIYKGSGSQFVTLRFSSYASRLIRDEIWHKDQTIIENNDGTVILKIPVSNLTEIRMQVMKYVSQVEVLEPEELITQIQEEIRKISVLYK